MNSTRKVLIITLLLSGVTGFAQSNMASLKSSSLTTPPIQYADSVYYGCVPCCQACSKYTTDKPGKCPHCGMTLEKRVYYANNENKVKKTPLNNHVCKPTKSKNNKE